ncbi:hypothetical protein PA08_1595 [Cutibacterium modestum P08]|nr:hypothetical protein PA08_1595 [Cutibacterium modestum P08]
MGWFMLLVCDIELFEVKTRMGQFCDAALVAPGELVSIMKG